ncbi:MAG: hypothetical protein L0Z50_11945 [Verrucomicrobiales bacterium]|nr:hypothetical protein [Verrucomicrobiales bacterium]
MLERANPILKLVCLGFAALVLFQCARFLARKSPFAHVNPAARLSSVRGAPPAAKGTLTNVAPSVETRNPGPAVSPAVQARIDRITQSEILAPVIRPLPMALLGIAGRDAFLRSDNGQTGLVREGEEMGGIKLLHIGTNRVLIEHAGQRKELMMFGGFGSETLLPKEKENPK